MPLYFAYGANMDVQAMASRCPSSKPIGLARLPRHRWIISTDGFANIVRDARKDVHGMLWELALSDMPPLDRFEDVPKLYSKVNQPVISSTGIRRALIYVGRSAEVGKPRPGYLADVVKAAESAGLPALYIAELRKFGDLRTPTPRPATPAVASEEPLLTKADRVVATEKWVWTP
jgi:gamma-glutamylcyclotransferase (GGCT)/AIG2-like uncharacterized protein YtfP